MTTPERPSLRDLAADLLTEVGLLRRQVELLDRGLRRGQRIVRIVIVSLVLDVIFSVSIFWLAHTNSQTLHNGCVAGNEIRAAELSMWDGVFDLFPPPQTEEGKAQVQAVREKARETFITRQCS